MNKKVFGLMALALATLAPVANAQTSEPVVTSVAADEDTESTASIGLLYGRDALWNGSHDTHGRYMLVGEFKATDHIRISPEIGTTRCDRFSTFNVGLNIHEVWSLNKLLRFDGPNVNVYGITGVAIDVWSYKYGEARTIGLGANVGAGADVTLAKHLKLSAQYRITPMTKEISHSDFFVGIQYAF